MDKRGMDLKGLAEQTGLFVQFLENMLNENVYPPLGPLMKIARALGVRLGTFLDDQGKADPFIVLHSTRGAEFSVPAVSGKIQKYKLTEMAEQIWPERR